MAPFCVALQLAALLNLVASNSLQGAKIFPIKNPIADVNNEFWMRESNLVEPPEPTSTLWKVFEKPKLQKFTSNYIKNLVKALYKFDSFHKRQPKTIPRSEDQELKSDVKTMLISNRNIFQKEQTTKAEDLSSPIPPAIEDLSEVVLQIPSQMEVDKSQKFTHSIRYGYGKSAF